MENHIKSFGWLSMTVLALLVSVYATVVLLIPRFDAPFVTALRAVAPWAVIAWCCWVPNLVAAEWIVLRAPARPARAANLSGVALGEQV